MLVIISLAGLWSQSVAHARQTLAFRRALLSLPSQSRLGSRRRDSRPFRSITQYLSANEFRSMFRMERRAFYKLLCCIRGDLERNDVQARRSSSRVTSPELRLAVCLRILSGASFLDCMLSFGIAKSTVYDVFHSTVRAINLRRAMDGVPLDDDDALRALADGFHFSRRLPNQLYGCIGALDGISIEISKPSGYYNPRNYYCRKCMYAIPFQAIVDS